MRSYLKLGIKPLVMGALVFGSMGGAPNVQAASGVSETASDTLIRRGDMGMRLTMNKDGEIVIRSIGANSPFASLGLKEGDQILSIDGLRLKSRGDISHLYSHVRSGKKMSVTYMHDSAQKTGLVTLNPVGMEQHDNLVTIYDHVVNKAGQKQRIIYTRPKGNSGKQGAVLFLQGLSCSSVELTPDRTHNYAKLIRSIVTETGHATVRIQKPGVGDSEGRCSDTDFKTELSGYEAAIKYMQNHPEIDGDNIIVYGNSMGSVIAPYLVNKYGLKAVISDGSFFKSWFEHMLEIERRIKGMQGKTESEISTLMNTAYIPLYYGMLIEKKSYGQIVDERPAIKPHNYHGRDHMYGRPMAYYHQVQDFDVAGIWQALKAPLRLRYGTHDWIMTGEDNQMILAAVRSNGNTDVEYKTVKDMDHWATLHPNPKSSFTFQKGKYSPEISGQIVNWIKELMQK